MLHFLTMADNRGPIRRYLRWWGGDLRGRVRLIPYERIADPSALPDGSYIFGDLERLPLPGLDKAGAIFDALARRGARVRLLNRPGAALRRRELLRALHANGINRFNVHDIDAPRDAIRFPVFIRSMRQHTGPLSALLRDAATLDAALATAKAGGADGSDLLIVEYLDTRSGDLYRKYSVAKIGDVLLAQHIFFNRNWVVKGTPHWPPEHIREDEEFMLANPHAASIGPIFDLARIDFGRIDYAVLDGAVQVWEINTVPMILLHRKYYGPVRVPAKEAWARRFNAALAALDAHSPPPGLLDRAASWRDLLFGKSPPPA
jgi:hypothetical protein